ncbi:MAG TPA: Gfo/Idh/MocA family oxidoreductase [Chthonomonadales bacterium]|nr:Gfo/Idh/MocA family oxidoreductase [Chthonomonadales bacterium]
MEPRPVTCAELGVPDRLPLPRRTGWRIGIVGFGGIARNAHAPAYRYAGWRIVAAADPDPDARRAAAAMGIERVVEDYRELIADPAVEVVDLLTQPTLREDVVLCAAEHARPIIVEKPFAGSVEECERMVAIAQEAGILLAVHQNYRWMATPFLARHIVAAGIIGAPYLATIQIYGRQDVGLAGHPFYAACGDFLTVQWNNHLADLLRCWMGRDAVRVLARTGRMDGQSFASDNLLCSVADFGPGATGHILHTELLRSSLTAQPCRIEGDCGSLVFDLWGDHVIIESQRLGGGPRRLDAAALRLAPSFAGSMGDFLLAIEEGREPEVSGRRNLATIRTVLAEHRSAQAGGVWEPVGA